MDNYIYNLTEANLTPHRRPHWFKLYDYRSTFNLDNLTPQTMNDLTFRMASTDPHLLTLYSAFHSKLSDARWPGCGNSCRLGHLCNIVVTELWERAKCNELTELFNMYN